MTTPSREAVFEALFALGQDISWTDPATGQASAWQTARRSMFTIPQLRKTDASSWWS